MSDSSTASNFTFDGSPRGIIDALEQRLEWTDHFLFVNDEDWVITADGTAVFQSADAEGGWLQMATDAANDNDEVYASTGEAVKFVAGKKVAIWAKLKLTEAATSAANILFGLTDQGGANTLVDNGGGPPSSYSGAVIFKVDGTMTWVAEASKTTSQSTLTAASCPAFVSATEYMLGIIWDGEFLHFYVDGVEIHTVTSSTYFSTTEMTPTFGLKNGSSNVETLLVDWWILRATR